MKIFRRDERTEKKEIFTETSFHQVKYIILSWYTIEQNNRFKWTTFSSVYYYYRRIPYTYNMKWVYVLLLTWISLRFFLVVVVVSVFFFVIHFFLFSYKNSIHFGHKPFEHTRHNHKQWFVITILRFMRKKFIHIFWFIVFELCISKRK